TPPIAGQASWSVEPAGGAQRRWLAGNRLWRGSDGPDDRRDPGGVPSRARAPHALTDGPARALPARRGPPRAAQPVGALLLPGRDERAPRAAHGALRRRDRVRTGTLRRGGPQRPRLPDGHLGG